MHQSNVTQVWCGYSALLHCSGSSSSCTFMLLSLALQQRTDFDTLQLLAVARLGLQSVEVLLCVESMF